MELLEWYNLIFVAPVGLAGIYLLLSAVGLGGEVHGDADVDHDIDFGADHDLDFDHDVDVAMDHDVDFDHDVEIAADHDLDFDHDVEVAVDHDIDLGADHDLDVDHDVTVEHDLEADHDVSAEHDVETDQEAIAQHGIEHEAHEVVVHHPSLMLRALSVLGFGKVPVSILMTCLMVLFGASGLIANGVFDQLLPWAPALYVWPSLALAVAASLTLTGTVARGLYRIMPTRETYAVTEEELVGRVGVSVYGIREGTCGPVNVKDESGTVHLVGGRSAGGDVPKSTEVILVRYHREGDYYDVAGSPLAAVAQETRGNAGAKGDACAEDVAARGHGKRASTARGDDVLTQQ